MKKNKLFILAYFFLSITITAQEIIPGLIPKFYSIEAATDLSVPASVAHQMALNGEDISLLDPDPSTNIWSPEKNAIIEHQLVANDQTVYFTSDLPSRIGYKRFTAKNEAGKELVFMLSKKAHNLLLRKNILEKLGYIVPAVQWVSKTTIKFNSKIDKDIFIGELKDKLLGDLDRWVVSQDDTQVVIQDLLAQTPRSDIYNLSLGIMAPHIVRGRRLIRSAYIPISLVDTPESVNLFPWLASRVILNQIKLNHTEDIQVNYGTSFEDAKWIGRKLGKLTREDFLEIVQKSYYPKAIEKLLVEKIISRRNNLIESLDLSSEYKALSFNPEISHGKELVKGEVVKEFFEGFASRFSYGDPESPFSASEIGFFVLSKIQSEFMGKAISELNKVLSSDTKQSYIEKVQKIIEKEGVFYPVSAVVVPTVSGNVTVSRNIVTGPYLGVDNKVQLVDNFGFGLNVGAVAGLEGGDLPATYRANTGISFQRVYSHVKPVTTLKKSFKEPYKNLLVPFLMKGLLKEIEEIDANFPEEEREKKLSKAISKLKSVMGIGESFIVSDSITPSLRVSAEVSGSTFYAMDDEALKVYGSVETEKLNIARFHLHRKSENEFQVYQSYGKGGRLEVSIKLKSYIPLLGVRYQGKKGKIETKAYSFELDGPRSKFEIVKALGRSIKKASHKYLKNIASPHKLTHEFKEKIKGFNFLFFHKNKVGTTDEMMATHSEGGRDRNIFRRYDATSSGVNFEQFATEVVNEVFSQVLEHDLDLSTTPLLNPGLSIFGKSKNRVFTSEYEKENGGIFLTYDRIFNGWKVKGDKIGKMAKLLNKELGKDLFNELSYKNTESILLYRMVLQTKIAPEGTDILLGLDRVSLQSLLNNYPISDKVVEPRERQQLISRLVSKIKSINESLKVTPKAAMKEFHAFTKALFQKVTIVGIEKIVGSENIVYQGVIEGFRSGDENGDKPIFSDTFGTLPVWLHLSPSDQIIQNWNVLPGEFVASWMIERVL